MRDVKEPEVRQAQIMEAALMLFMEKGYLNTSTQDIIDKVQISRGLLYYHFKNKEDILYCLVERYSEPILRKLSAISYDKNKSAIEKIKSFIEATIISPDTITNEKIALQKTLDLEQNRYVMDRFSHNLSSKVTEYVTNIIEQGTLENVFHVEHPLETASFLITGYVFVSNDVKVLHTDTDRLENYLAAFKIILAKSLDIDPSVFSD